MTNETIKIIAQADALCTRINEAQTLVLWSDADRSARLGRMYKRAAQRFYRRGGEFYTEGTWTGRLESAMAK